MNETALKLHLFEAYGIELEYMIVDGKSLDVLPVADKVLRTAAGETVNEVVTGGLAWSNELVLHVIELKTNGPAPSLNGLSDLFRDDLARINTILEPINGRLMPTGMHPWMDPPTQTVLWPHENDIIYQTYDRIFGCKGHGWSNLQSMHLNLPFFNEEDFVRLHTAIRIILPIIPALAASTPIVAGSVTGVKDNRMEAYRHNQEMIPSIAGMIVPEPIRSIDEYENTILKRMYRDIAPYDPEAVLQEEWLNSRGAIARFERNSIEIRIIDVQECPLADLAIAALVTGVVKALANEQWSTLEDQLSIQTQDVFGTLLGTIHLAEDYLISDRAYLRLFGIGSPAGGIHAGTLWKHLFDLCTEETSWEYPVLEKMLAQGSLSTRILESLGNDRSVYSMKQVYATLCNCLVKNDLFLS